MTLADLEEFLNSINYMTMVILNTKPEGWGINLRVPVGSPLHLPEAGSRDCLRLFRGPTIEAAVAEAVAAVSALAIDEPDEDDIFG